VGREGTTMTPQETLYLNAHVHTFDRGNLTAEAILVQGDRIAAVGARDAVEGAAGKGARRVDLAGSTVVPGFNDSHCHILSFGLDLDRLDVSPEAARTIEDVKRAVARRAEETAENGWVLGRGYNQNDLDERRHPTRHDLDVVSPDHPVVLWHTSGHALTCNSRALARAGITAATETPFGGAIERDEHGEPTGVLMEDPAMEMLAAHIPRPTIAEGAEAIVRAMQAMAREGITSASDAATGEGESIDAAVMMYQQAL
jgi:predicted amidohydrolase YtcJ